MINIREYFSPRKRLNNFQRIWNAGGYAGVGYTNRIEFTTFATITAQDSLMDLNTGIGYNSSGPGLGCIYISEGYTTGGTNEDDVDKINVAVFTLTNNIADIGVARAGSGAASGPHKLWLLGGSTSIYYDDVTDMPFATETCSYYTSGQISSARTRMGAAATNMKLLAVGGQNSGGDVNIIEGWSHSTQTLMDITDLQTANNYVSCNLSDTAIYATCMAENERFTLATETTVDVNSPPESTRAEVMGNGMFGTGALLEGGSSGGTELDSISMLSYATETWHDTTQTMTLAVEKIGPCSGG